MVGNCATGKVSMVRVPTSTMMMAITMATMGRLMKNLDIESVSLRRGKRLGIHAPPRTHLLHPFGDDSFSRIQPLCDHPLVARRVAHRDRSNAHLVVTIYDGNLVSALKLRHRALRHQQCVMLQPDDGAHFGVASRPQNVSRIREQPRDSNRARALVDLPVRKVEG